MSINMSATSMPSRLGSLFKRNGSCRAQSHGLSARLEEPEATTSERTIGAAAGGASNAAQEHVVEPDQISKASRRRYTREEKLRILRLAEACKERGQLGALLRREGIYFSTLRQFRLQRENGRLEPGHERDKQAARAELAADKKRIADLETQNRQLKRQLEQAELIIDVQKKLSQLLGITLPSTQESSQTPY
jgi:transposase-like protein